MIARNEKNNNYFHMITDPDLTSPKLEGQSPVFIIPNSSEYFNPAVIPIAGNTIGDMNRNAGSGVLKGHVEKPEYSPDAAPLSFINTTDIQVQPHEQNNHIFTMEEISQMPPDEIRRNLPEIERQTSLGLIQH